jgi:Activator of aromatic catabolism/Sigma-54 interaction domain/Bacterial regulatory protein, Fis family
LQVSSDEEALLDRSGRPTLRELLRQLVFSPGSGSIRLNKERLILQRASQTSCLRDQLVERHGRDDAFVTLTRLGFCAGAEDADFVRKSWPGLDPGDVFTAGTRLHMLCGCVRLKTVHNDFDFRKGKFSGEFLWYGSAEATEYRRRHGVSAETVCWSQIGYASGYATRCFGRLIVYKELECLGMGRDCCRLMGKPAEAWGEQDDVVQLYRREIVPAEPVATVRRNASNSRFKDEDPVTALLLAPVREQLEQVAKFDVPLLIAGELGTGKRAAACAWGQARFGDDVILDFIASETLDAGSLETLIEDPVRPGPGRRPHCAQKSIVLTDVDLMSPQVQRRLARKLDEGFVRIAVTTRRTIDQLCGSGCFDEGLLHRLAVAPMTMPPLRARREDIPALAECLLWRAARRHGLKDRPIAEDARKELAALDLPGNLIELDAIMTGALIRGRPGVPIDADLIRGLAAPSRSAARAIQDDAIAAKALGGLSSGPVSLNVLNNQLYRQAMERSHGNVAAAARMLGLSRAKLAYRLKLSRREM